MLRVVPDDLDLAERCVRGDRAAQRQLFEREKRRVHAILYRLLGTNGPMEDLLQEAFLEIFRSLGSYRGEAAIGTWVDRCTVRVAYRWLRRRRVFLELAHDISSTEPSAERKAVAREGAASTTAPIALPAPSTTAAASTTSHIVTTDAPASVSFGESSLDVGPASELVATGDDGHGVLVVLERGSVKLHVPPRAGRPPLSVLAGSVRVQVMGTRFSVERNGSDVRVHVDDGTVQVTNGADVVLVHASESWPTPPSAPTVAHSAPAPKIDDEAAFERAARSERTDPDGALRLYEGIVARGGAWAPNALYAEGRLELDRGHTANGRRLLELYLKRYPRGTNAADAKSLLEK